MRYVSIICNNNLIPGHFVAIGLVDEGGNSHSIVDVIKSVDLNRNNYISPIAIIYPENRVIMSLVLAVSNGVEWDWLPLHVLCNNTILDADIVLTVSEVGSIREWDAASSFWLTESESYYTEHITEIASYTYNEVYENGSTTLNKILATRQLSQRITPTNEALAEIAVEQTTIQQEENLISEPVEIISEPVEVSPEQTVKVVEQVTEEVKQAEEVLYNNVRPEVETVGAVNFMTAEVEEANVAINPVIENHVILTEQPTTEQPTVESIEIKTESPVPAVIAEQAPIIVSETKIVESTVEQTESANKAQPDTNNQTASGVTTISNDDMLEILSSSNKHYNQAYKYETLNFTGFTINAEEIRKGGPVTFNSPLTDIEKYIIMQLSADMGVTFNKPPFMDYITNIETFKNIILDCIDSFKDNNTFAVTQAGNESDKARTYMELRRKFFRPTVLYPTLNENAVVDPEVLKEVSTCTGNILEDMVGVNLRFIWILLQLDIPVQSDYNGVYFSIYLSRLMYAISRVYSLLDKAIAGDEDKVIFLVSENTVIANPLYTTTIGDLLNSIEMNVIMCYSKCVLGFILGQQDEDHDMDTSDDTFQFSWTADYQINLGAIMFMENEFLKNPETTTNFMLSNGCILVEGDGDNRKMYRMYDTVSELISAFGYQGREMSLAKSELSFSEGMSMPDLKCRFLDTKIEFTYREEPLLNDVIFHISYSYNRTVNMGMDDTESMVHIDNFWKILEATPKLYDFLFGVGLNPVTHEPIIDINKIGAENSVFAIIADSIGSEIDIFKEICKEIYPEQTKQLYGSLDQIDTDEDTTKTLSAKDYMSIFINLWDSAKKADPEFNKGAIRRLIFSSEHYFSATIREAIINYAYTLYNSQTLSADAVKDVDACVAAQHILYALAYGENTAGCIPKTMDFRTEAQVNYYTTLWNSVPNTFGMNKHSLNKIIHTAKLGKIQHFKQTDTYNKARRELISSTDSDIKRKIYESGTDLKLLQYGINHDVQYLVSASITSIIDLNTGAPLNNGRILTNVLGFLCTNSSTGNDTLEYVSAIGHRSLNTLLKYGYKFNIVDQITKLKHSIEDRTPEGIVFLQAFRNSNLYLGAKKKQNQEPSEEDCVEWLSKVIFSVLSVPIDEKLLQDDMIIDFNSGYLSTFKDPDNKPIGKLPIKTFNSRYLKCLEYVTKVLDPIKNDVFTIKYLNVNLSQKTTDKNGKECYKYGKSVNANNEIEYSTNSALLLHISQNFLNTLRIALIDKTNGDFYSQIQLSKSITQGDILDKNSNPVYRWNNIFQKEVSEDNHYPEPQTLSLAYWSLFQAGHIQQKG